ncbi:hypothetical protein KKC56_03520 [Patescibacteria group bacterium]|nr:hypothetical protein [Patescibacteria group bacterium]
MTKKILWILFYIFIFFFLLNNSFSYLDPDLGWHLKVGESIIHEQSVPHINYYNYTLENTKWVDHEWLMDIIVFWIYQNLGYLWVNIFFVLIVLILLIVLHIFAIILLQNANLILIAPLYILGLLAMAPHLGVRMQEITLLFLLLLIIILHYYTKNKNFQLLFCLPILFYVWACSHAGFLIGIFILFFWVAIKLIEFKLYKYKNKLCFVNFSNILNLKQIIIFLLFVCVSILTTFFTPYKSGLYKFLYNMKNTFYLTHIQEWLPQYYFPFQYWQIIYLAVVITAIMLLFIYAVKQNKNKINLWDIFISLFFVFLTFKSKRHFPLLFIVSFPMLICFFKTQIITNSSRIITNISAKIIFIYLTAGLAIISLSQIITTNFSNNPFNSFCNKYPCKAVKFLKQNQQYDNFNIFNSYTWGGYLIWTYPEKKLFIDGRLPQYEFGEHTMLEEYFEFYDKNKIQNKLKQHNIKLVLLDIKTRKFRLNWFEKYFLDFDEDEINESANTNNLKDYLDNSNEWQIVYNDNISNIYVNRILSSSSQ